MSIEARNIRHHVGAQRVSDPDGKANDKGVDQLEKLLIEAMLPGQHQERLLSRLSILMAIMKDSEPLVKAFS